MAGSLSAAERTARLRLALSQNVGPVTFRDLLQQFGSGIEALAALPELAARGGAKARLRIASEADAERELKAATKIGAGVLCLGEPDYPLALAEADPPPPYVFVKGHRHLLSGKSVAIVGARNASAAGRRLAETLAADLGARGLVVVSGLARGIDGAAHRGALPTGTAAVLAGGLDVIYPPEHDRLHAAISEEGVLVSEMRPGTEPKARYFPRRNRIISGLSLGVVVMEAALRSGSLITARFALEQNREVMAVPGHPSDPRAQGVNKLIKQGAALVESAEDVLAVLEPALARPVGEPDRTRFAAEPAGASLDPDERERVIELLGPSPVETDTLVRESGLSPAQVRVVLLELELAGRLSREPGDRVSLIAEPPS